MGKTLSKPSEFSLPSECTQHCQNVTGADLSSFLRSECIQGLEDSPELKSERYIHSDGLDEETSRRLQVDTERFQPDTFHFKCPANEEMNE
jgi:hypothetical protein